MPMSAVCLPIDGQRLVQSLQDAIPKLEGAAGEAVLDFSAVRRIEPDALHALEKLAAAADEKSVKLVLSGVNIDVYRVIKLMKLAPRFTFPA